MPDPIAPYVAERLGFYVYVYVDPCTGEAFYVGKGQGSRALSHLRDPSESSKVARIRDLEARGVEPRIDILVHGLPSEEAALRIESAVIDVIGRDKLTNAVRGWESGRVGRMPLKELLALYGATPVTIDHPALLIRINRLYRHDMTPEELYEATRGIWKLGARRVHAHYALSVFHGVVRAVFKIDSWHEAGTTPYHVRVFDDRSAHHGRWEFLGHQSDETVREQYMGRSVQHYFKRGLQSPVVYVNCH